VEAAKATPGGFDHPVAPARTASAASTAAADDTPRRSN